LGLFFFEEVISSVCHCERSGLDSSLLLRLTLHYVQGFGSGHGLE